MALITKKITLDITPGAIPQIINVSLKDIGRAYEITLMDDGGVFTIPAGTTAKVEGTRPRYPFSEAAAVSGNTITFQLTTTMTAVAGDAWTKIMLTKDDEPVSTCAFILRVDRGLEAKDVIDAPGFQEQIRDAAEDWLEEQGFQSPTVSITPITGGNRVTFTDAEHPQGQSIDVMDGQDGESGAVVDPTLTIEGEAADAKATGDAIKEIVTEGVPVGLPKGNILNPALVQDLDYYYNKTSGAQTANTNHYWLAMAEPQYFGEMPIVLYFRSNMAVSRNFYALCYDENDTFLGSGNVSFNSLDEQHLILKSGTRKIRFEIDRGNTTSLTAENACISFESLEEFAPYGGAESSALKINDELLLDFRSDLLSELTTTTQSVNLVDPNRMKTWGYSYGVYGGQWGTVNEQNQAQKEKIDTNSAVDLYCIVRKVASGGSSPVCRVFCWNSEDTWIQTLSFSITTTDIQHITLPSGTAKIAFAVNIYAWYFDPADLCISFSPLTEFVEYSSGMVIKPELIGESQEGSIGLFKKKIVVFGDSIFAGSIPDYIGQMTKANVYNAALGGTSASDRNPSGGLYTHDLAMFSIAHAINTGEWATILSSAQNSGRGYDYTRMLYCSQLDWSTVDIVILAFGANDPYNDAENSSDQFDVTLFSGAMRYIISQIQTAYPNIRIFCCNVINSIGQPQANRSAGNQKLKEICDAYHVGFIDNYTNLGINDLTVGVYLGSDRTHPNDKGSRLIAAHVAHELW